MAAASCPSLLTQGLNASPCSGICNPIHYLPTACRLMAAADHPNLLTFHEAFVERAQLFVVTELAPGGDLGALLG